MNLNPAADECHQTSHKHNYVVDTLDMSNQQVDYLISNGQSNAQVITMAKQHLATRSTAQVITMAKPTQSTAQVITMAKQHLTTQ